MQTQTTLIRGDIIQRLDDLRYRSVLEVRDQGDWFIVHANGKDSSKGINGWMVLHVRLVFSAN